MNSLHGRTGITNTLYDVVANRSTAQSLPVYDHFCANVFTKHRPDVLEAIAYSDYRKSQVHKTRINTRTDTSPSMYD